MNRHFVSLVFIIIAGEAIFMPPFVIPRLYRPVMLQAWGLTNTDFGSAFAAYGITALISYLIGGPLADRYHPRILMSSSLVLTALGGVYLALFPSVTALVATYGFFGVSTILLFWGALIKTTHVAGGDDRRSLAMGILDSGRGLTAAVFASFLVVTLAVIQSQTTSAPMQIVQTIYFLTAGLLVLVAVGIWFSLTGSIESAVSHEWKISKTFKCLKDPNVWLLSIVILGSYCGYKGIDNYSIYLVDVHKLDATAASRLTSIVFWLRPVAALLAGFTADKLHRKNGLGRFQVLSALLLLGGLSQFLLAALGANILAYSFLTIIFSSTFVYALRAIYFSIFGDLKIPDQLVGTTVGIVSFVGFMPDIFFGFVTGRLIDSHAGSQGFQLAFMFTGACLILGATASYAMYRRSRRRVTI